MRASGCGQPADMARRTSMSRFERGRFPALAAIFFGALLYGPGNAFLTPPEHGAHRHRNAGPYAPTSMTAWNLPAHCLFCLDGIAPQPTELILAAIPESASRLIIPAARVVGRHAPPRTGLPPSRAPPASAI